ncbi:MAG: hypothetical protein AAF770_00575 [Bacteroidota bacterium]
MNNLFLYLFLCISTFPLCGKLLNTKYNIKQVKSSLSLDKKVLRAHAQSTKKRKILIAIGCILLIPLYLFLFKLFLILNRSAKNKISEDMFRQAFVDALNSQPIELNNFREIRSQVDSDVLNHTAINNYPNALMMAIDSDTVSQELFKILVDDGAQAAKVEVTPDIFRSVIKNVITSTNSAYLLEDILHHCSSDLIAETLLEDLVVLPGYKGTALDIAIASVLFFPLQAKAVISILLSRQDDIVKQLNATEQGLRRAVWLVLQEPDQYIDHLERICKEASSDLLHRTIFPKSGFDSHDYSDNKREITLLELAATKVYTEAYKPDNAYKRILDLLVNNEAILAKLPISEVATMTILHTMGVDDLHDDCLSWLKKMLKKASSGILSKVLEKIILLPDFEESILNLLLNREDSQQSLVATERTFHTIIERIIRQGKFQYIPLLRKLFDHGAIDSSLLTRQIFNQSKESVLPYIHREVTYRYIFSQNDREVINLLLQQNRDHSLLFTHDAKGFYSAVLLADMDKSYTSYLTNLLIHVDDSVLYLGLFSDIDEKNPQTAFEYAVNKNKKNILEAILTKKSYREKLFTKDSLGFQHAVQAAVITSSYKDKLKEIYSSDRSLLQKLLFGDQNNQTALDYFISKSSPTGIEALLSDITYKKREIHDTPEGFKRAVEVAVVNHSYLADLQEVCKEKDNQFLDQRLFDTNRSYRVEDYQNQLYDSEDSDNPYAEEIKVPNKNRVKGRSALDYAIAKESTSVVNILLELPSYQAHALNPNTNLGFQRLILIPIFNPSYLEELKRVRPELTGSMLRKKLFAIQSSALGKVLYLLSEALPYRSMLPERVSNLKKIVDILLDDQNSSDLNGVTDDGLKQAIFNAKNFQDFDLLTKVLAKTPATILNSKCYYDAFSKRPLEYVVNQGLKDIFNILFSERATYPKPKVTLRAFKLAVSRAIWDTNNHDKLYILQEIVNKIDNKSWLEKKIENGKTALKMAENHRAILAILQGV